ncbi:immunoglobulin lambda-1 light chain-like isoform X4 [Brienomyrus brachyistius]|uniref:immunoglobulin lambda-1 light chain-like isoform X3 n=1 Tax=Brienomyrus brachyistius TaxID=42636 RepID=UPI0020B26DBF|nr:immunoglobulin lambda-1 light chain-like isoform X3 [Brienomyrus brachyistius]XP_048867770.1 immunoglobulin lambda-1 light chain-like isoform X4 [Brienomyrus brachyistius]
MALRRTLVSALVTALLFCVVAVQAMLDHNRMTITKEEGKTVIIGCRNKGNCYSYLHWYQKKDGSAMQRILYINLNGRNPENEQGFEKFEADLVGDTYRLRISELEPVHAATYYCACWVTEGGYSYKLFGPGTKLVVSDRKPAFPSVTLYHSPKKRELLCVARDMFPDVLKMTWKKWDGSKLQDVNQKIPTTIQEMKGTVSSLIISEKSGMEELRKYRCQVVHEGNPEAQEYKVTSTDAGGIDNSGPSVSDPVTCGPKTSNYSSAVSDADPITKSELLTISLSYCMLILKSLTYFGTMSVVIYKRSRQTS